MAQSRRFCITIFSPVEGKKPKEPAVPDFADFFIGQREICPKTGKRHYQCYLETAKKVTLGSIIKKIENHLDHHAFHVEIARGTQKQNIDYCTKDDSADGHRFRHGEPMHQGQRNDLIEIADAIKSGITEAEILDTKPHWFFHDKYMNKLIQVKNNTYKYKLRDIKVFYICGPPGSGKSSYVWEQIQGQSYYQPPPMRNGHLWFDGYTGQDILWLEDVDLQEFSRSTILRLLDRYPLTCEVKGGTVQACWTTVYITSNFEPEYLDEAIQRRFEDVLYFENDPSLVDEELDN